MVVLSAVETLENAIKLNPIFLYDEGNADHILFVDGVIKLHVLFSFHPHTSLALIKGYVAVPVEVNRIPSLHHMVVEEIELLPH